MMSAGPDIGIHLGTKSRRAWNPRTLGASFWWRADVDITAPGNAASAIGDQSGNARHLTQGTSGNQPTWSSNGGPGGGPCIIHTAPRYLLLPDGAWKTSAWTFAALVKLDTLAAYQHAYAWAHSATWSNGGGGLGNVNGTASGNLKQWFANYNSYGVTWVAVGTSGWYLYIQRYDAATQVLKGRRNATDGTNVASVPNTHGTGALSVGAAYAGGTSYLYNLEGRWAEIEMFPSSLSDADCVRLKDYTSSSWGGITLS